MINCGELEGVEEKEVLAYFRLLSHLLCGRPKKKQWSTLLTRG